MPNSNFLRGLKWMRWIGLPLKQLASFQIRLESNNPSGHADVSDLTQIRFDVHLACRSVVPPHPTFQDPIPVTSPKTVLIINKQRKHRSIMILGDLMIVLIDKEQFSGRISSDHMALPLDGTKKC